MVATTTTAVEPTVIYTLTDMKEKFGMGKGAMRAARRRGLEVRKLGKRSVVLGEELARYLRENTATV